MSGPIVNISRTETFSCAHRLHSKFLSDEENKDVFGKCNNANGHGHNYAVTVTLRGVVDSKTGMVANLVDVGMALRHVASMVDHKHLDLDVPYFKENNIVSTAENIAVFFWRMLKQFPKVAPLLSLVTIEETSKNSCSFDGTNEISREKLHQLKGLYQPF